MSSCVGVRVRVGERVHVHVAVAVAVAVAVVVAIGVVCLMLKNIKSSDTDKTISTTLRLFCIKMFLEAMSARLRNLKNLHRRNL